MRRAAICLVAVTMWVGAVGAEPLTLEAAIDRARAANLGLAAATADVAAARGRLVQASVWAPNPTIAGEANRHSLPGGVTNIDSTVTLGQEVQIGGQRGLRITAAQFDVEHAERARADRARLVDGEARRAFAGLVGAERRRILAVDAASQADRLAGIAATRLAHGDVARMDVDLTRLDVVKTLTDASTADVELERARTRLAAALGADADEVFAVVAPEERTHEAPSEPDAIERALAARPDLAAARAARAQLDGQADLVRRTGTVPNPTLSGFYSHQNGHENLLGGQIQIPIPVFDRQAGAETDLRGQAASAATETRRLQQQIPREVRAALAHYRAAVAAWQRYHRDALPATAGVRAGLDQAVAAGLLGIPDVLVQLDRLRDARRAAVDAWVDRQEAEADVIEAIGEDPW
jgi:cobalt-zinc-cadmium efflux system outer membrane protein